jgi:hypothetical protein
MAEHEVSASLIPEPPLTLHRYELRRPQSKWQSKCSQTRYEQNLRQKNPYVFLHVLEWCLEHGEYYRPSKSQTPT